MRTDFTPYTSIIIPIDELRDYHDWYPRLVYILNYTLCYEQKPRTRSVEYLFNSKWPNATEFGKVCGVTRQTASRYLEGLADFKETKSWIFQRIIDNYLTLPLKKIDALLKIAANSNARNRSVLIKVGLFFIGQIRAREFLGQSNFSHSVKQIALAIDENAQEVSKIINILLDNNVMRRNVVGNAFIQKSSSYSF